MPDFLDTIHSTSKSFSASQRRIAAYVEDNLARVAYMRANLLAEEVGVSSASVVRFAQALGYSGYLEMQRAVLDLVDKCLDNPTDPLPAGKEASEDSRASVATLAADRINLSTTFARLSTKGFEDIVANVQRADRVIFTGLKYAGALFTMFSEEFRTVGKDVVSLSYDSPDANRILDSLTDRDVIFCIVLSANATFVLDLVTSRSSSGAKIVAITDRSLPGDTQLLSAVLHVSTQLFAQTISLTSTVSLLQAIVVALKWESQNKFPTHSPHLWALQEVFFHGS